MGVTAVAASLWLAPSGQEPVFATTEMRTDEALLPQTLARLSGPSFHLGRTLGFCVTLAGLAKPGLARILLS